MSASYSNRPVEGTITQGCDEQSIRRLIGVKGTGIARITGEIRRLYPGSRPYIRADRDTNILTLTTRGDDAVKALQAMSEKVKLELAWINGTSDFCPHPKIDVPEPENKELLRHIIGASGSKLREITNRIARGETGPGCFIIHKRDLGVFRIEGVSLAQVELGKRRLNDHIRKITEEQIPRRVDLEGLAPPPPLVRSARTDTTAQPSQTQLPVVQEDTNSFDALRSSDSEEEVGSGEEEEEEEEVVEVQPPNTLDLTRLISEVKDEDEDRKKQTYANKAAGPAASKRVQFLRDTGSTRGDVLAKNREFNEQKALIAAELGIEFWQVSDRLVNKALRDKATATRPSSAPAASSVDTSSHDEFPGMKTGEENITLRVKTGSTVWDDKKKIATTVASADHHHRQPHSYTSVSGPVEHPRSPRQNVDDSAPPPRRPTVMVRQSSSVPPSDAWDGDTPDDTHPTRDGSFAFYGADSPVEPFSPLPRPKGENHGNRSWFSDSDDDDDDDNTSSEKKSDSTSDPQ